RPLVPSQAAIADDGEQPGPRVAVAIGLEVAQRAERRILHGVLRLVWVAKQIAGERVRIVQMRQHDSLETVDVFGSHVRNTASVTCPRSSITENCQLPGTMSPEGHGSVTGDR